MSGRTTPSGLVAELSAWASGLRPFDIPPRVARLAQSQILSQLAAIRAGWAHPRGQDLVRAFGAPLQDDPARSACVLAGLGSWLNLDDTAYAGHLSNATVAVPVAYAHALGLTGRELVTAVVAANECAARITAASTLGPFRGQSAVQTALVGAVSGRLGCQRAPAEQWTNALGLALAMPPWTTLHGFLGSDARILSVLLPVRTSMDACDAAAAGLRGAADILEHPDGFLARFADVPLPEVVTRGLGELWHTDTLSFKMRPAGPGIDAAVDCAVELHAQHREVLLDHLDDIDEIVVAASAYTLYVGRRAEQYITGPDTPASTLPLSIRYALATALLHGDLTLADYAEPMVRDPRRWALAQRVRLIHDSAMTRELLTGEAPFGDAIADAGAAGAAWAERFFGDLVHDVAARSADPARNYENATKRTPAKVTVRLRDGRTFSRERVIPVGAAGPETRARHSELIRSKFISAGGDRQVADAWDGLFDAAAKELADLLETALRNPTE
ncbi:MmgE/PrpD family protein [Streptomyces asiaticus]|uniref:MmgE/PrpD family protein n=1 Tax=Streptomyces asiaticus TaxID=114695 RepID=UPI003D722A08